VSHFNGALRLLAMNPLNTLVKALLTGFGWRLGSEVAVAISNRVAGKSNQAPATSEDEEEDEDSGELRQP
jgi:hypothetical protein